MKTKYKFFERVLFVSLLPALVWFSATTSNAQNIQPPIPEGYSIIEGDIVLPTDFIEQAALGLTPEAGLYFATWTSGIVPFEFQITNAPASNCPGDPGSGAVSAANQTAMLNAMAVLEAVANVDFRECAGAACGTGNRILVRDSTNDIIRDSNNICVNGASNNSRVGMVGGQQLINIVNWETQFIIVHELLHALGFFHEQQRQDRNTYVTIVCAQVLGGCNGSTFLNNFPISNLATSFGYYDFDSVMHYGQCAFASSPTCSSTGGQTILVNAPYTTQWQANIGQRTRLSALDKASVSFLYPFTNWRFYDCTYNGSGGAPNGTFLRPYSNPLTAIGATPPVSGVLWVLKDCSFPSGTYNNRITIKTAPGITATFGG